MADDQDNFLKEFQQTEKLRPNQLDRHPIFPAP